jgi:cytochrome c oxidase cbb3-type subunit IV
MDVNDLRSVVTVVSLIAFLGIVVWAWSRSNRAGFDEAAQLPFTEEQGAEGASRGGNQQ